MVNNKKRILFYKSDEYSGKIPWKLKTGRDNLPDAINKVKQQENTDDRQAWIIAAKHWLKHRASGFENKKALSKKEIQLRKKELGKLLTEFNRYYSDGDLIEF